MRQYAKQFWKSKSYAIRGIQYAYVHEVNFRTQIAIACMVLVAMVVFQLTKLEGVVILFLIFAVLILELLNTAIEALSDVVIPRLHDHIKIVKDITAGMVLLASLLAIIVGSIIFLPYIFSLLG
jgi:diacylglycerol kinase